MKKMKKHLAIMLSIIMVLGMVPMMVSAEMLPGLVDLSRQAAAEGVVLLQNNNGVLPLKDEEISVFGRIQVDYFSCGYGSGGDVKYPYSTNLITGLRQHPSININENLAKIYKDFSDKNPPNHGSWGTWPTHHAEMPLTDEIASEAAKRSSKAVVVIGRSAGEDRESTLTKGSYYLTDLEVSMLDKVTANFEEVVVLLNVGNIIDMAWTETYGDKIDSILYVWQGGMESGKAVADVLSGDITPSGKMSSTIANKYADYPSSENFGKVTSTNYVEDIYVGYRYFETFAPEKIRYPFGYGLSYTDFETVTNSVTNTADEIIVNVTVKNIGEHKGKEVVQAYYGAPQGELGKAKKSLAAYAKTGVLMPGETQDITLKFDINNMASYDDFGYVQKSAYLLEAGDYPIYVGNSSRDCEVKGNYNLPELKIVEQLEEASSVNNGDGFDILYPVEDESGKLTEGSRAVAERTVNLKDRISSELPEEITLTVDKGHKLIDVYNGDVSLEDFTAQLTVEEAAALTRGDGPMGSSLGTAGNAAVFGGVLKSLRDKGIVPITTADGPSGIRISYSATLLPIGTTLACTWNDALVEKLYAGIGAEMVLNKVDALLAPGMNLHRDPLCGRNFEYFSEDPLLNGQMGAAVTKGVQSEGASTTPKHFAANNQETNRNYNDSRVSERAQRELYLKGFEICIKNAKPHNLMTSYNKINSKWGHYNYELCTTILRDEWGYEGVVMTDWWMRSATDPDFPDVKDNAYRVRSQVDVLMPGNDFPNTLMESYNKANGITLGEIQRSAMNVLNYVLISPQFAMQNDLPLYDYIAPAPYFRVETEVSDVDPRLNSLKVGGEDLYKFNPLTLDYTIFTKGLKDLETLPTVIATADEGIEVEIVQGTPSKPAATIRVRAEGAGGEENIYRVIFSDETGLEPSVENPIYAEINSVYINGKRLSTFYAGLSNYSIVIEDIENLEITADTPEGVDYTVTKFDDHATLRAESAHQAVEYQFYYAVAPKSDEFDGATLKDFWELRNGNDKFRVEDGYAKVTTERGDIYGQANDMNNYILQKAYGDWDSVARIEFDKHPFESFHQIGIMIMDDEANYLQLAYEYNNWGGTEVNPLMIRLKSEQNNSASTVATEVDIVKDMMANAPETREIFFKVEKRGNNYDFFASFDGETFTKVGATLTASFAEPKFVFANSNGSTDVSAATPSTEEPLEVKHDYVRFTHFEEESQVVSIDKENKTRIKLGEQFFHKTSGLGTEDTSDVGGGLNIGWTAAGEYLLYSVDIERAGYYDVTPRISSSADALTQISFGLELDEKFLTTFYRGGGTGGWQSWASLSPQRVYLPEGEHTLKFLCNSGSFNANWIEFEPINDIYEVKFNLPSSVKVDIENTNVRAGDLVTFTLDKPANQEIKSINLVSDENKVVLIKNANGSYSFIMPVGNIDITITLEDAVYIDYSFLKFMVNYADDQVEKGALEGTMPAIVKQFNEALKAAKDVLAKAAATPELVTQEEIDSATTNLLDAIQLIDFKSDKTNLARLISLSTTYEKDKEKYLKATYEVFEETLKTAKGVQADETAFQEEIDKAWFDLAEGLAGLRKIPNKDELKNLLQKAIAVNGSLYTEESYELLSSSIEFAEAVINNDSATENEAAKAELGLDNALKNLVPLANTDGITTTTNATESKATSKAKSESKNDVTDTTAEKMSTVPKTGEKTYPIFVITILSLAAIVIVIIRKKERT